MRNDDFELLLGLLEGLSAEQCERLRSALAARGEETAVLALIERRLGDRPGCHYCPAGHESVRRWGRSHGMLPTSSLPDVRQTVAMVIIPTVCSIIISTRCC